MGESASLTQWCALRSRLCFHRLDRLGHRCLLHSFFEPSVPVVLILLHHGLHSGQIPGRLLGRARQRHAKASGGLRLHLCETAVHEQLRSRDIAAVIGRKTRRPSRSPRAYRACRAAQCWKAASWSPLVVVTLSSLPRTFCFLGRRPTPRGFKTDGSPARSVYVDAYKYLARRRHHG